MKKAFLAIIICVAFYSCGNKPKNSEAQKILNEAEKIESEIGEIPKQTNSTKKLFKIKSGYLKFKSKTAGMDMIREWWFDDYGALQYEQNYLEGDNPGESALICNGFRYVWGSSDSTGTKHKFYGAATDYENVSDKDKERYGLKMLGQEDIVGKTCKKISMEKPMKATVWMWNGIGLKTVSNYAGIDVIMEAVEINESGVDASKFEVPSSITFNEM